jgi:hypothetical protein
MNTLSEEEQPSTSTVTGPIWPKRRALKSLVIWQ